MQREREEKRAKREEEEECCSSCVISERCNSCVVSERRGRGRIAEKERERGKTHHQTNGSWGTAAMALGRVLAAQDLSPPLAGVEISIFASSEDNVREVTG